MKICFLSHEYPPHSPGGIGYSIRVIACQLAHDHTVVVITCASGQEPYSFNDAGVLVHALSARIVRMPLLNYWFGNLIHKWCYNVHIYKKVRELGKEYIIIAPEFGFEGLLPAIGGWRVVTSLATPSFIDELYNRGKKSLQNRVISWCDVRCVFVGKDLMEFISSFKKAHRNCAVDHYAHMPHAELLSIIEKATVVVVPSRFENCSMVCLETLALGRPLIVTEHTGAAELIDPGVSGFTFTNEDVPQLVERIAYCLTHDMTVISRQAEMRSHRYSGKYVSTEYEKVLARLL